MLDVAYLVLTTLCSTQNVSAVAQKLSEVTCIAISVFALVKVSMKLPLFVFFLYVVQNVILRIVFLIFTIF